MQTQPKFFNVSKDFKPHLSVSQFYTMKKIKPFIFVQVLSGSFFYHINNIQFSWCLTINILLLILLNLQYLIHESTCSFWSYLSSILYGASHIVGFNSVELKSPKGGGIKN